MASYRSLSRLTRLTFSWVTPLIKRAHTSTLDQSALPTLPLTMEVAGDVARVSAAIARYGTTGYRAISWAILSVYRKELLKIVALSLLSLTLGLSVPLLLREILRGLHRDYIPPHWFHVVQATLPELLRWISYPLAASLALSVASLVSIFVVHHLFFIQPNLSFRVRAALNALIFSKVLRQERTAQHAAGSGFIVNLIGSDTQKVQILLGFFHSIWHHPLSLVCIMYMLYSLVGVAALIGCSSLLLLLLSSTAITRRQGKLRRQLSHVADTRIGLTRECLMHVKAAKLQGWEASLEKKILALREIEMHLSRRLIRLSAVFSFTSGSAPAVAMAITSICLVYQGVDLDAATLFPVLTLFMQLRFSLNILPDTVYNVIEARVALRRIASFFATPEFAPPRIDNTQQAALRLTGVESRWASGAGVASKVPHLEIPRGQLIVIVGPVGAGKSGLLLTMIGELPAEHGCVSLGGSVAYIPQVPWITSDSIRNNILFGHPCEDGRYQRALYASGLTVDLATLPHGDNTEIGERGINLSGGQRQRVALARALYSSRDIYLFDDPLSALDPQVAHHVFSQLICNELRGKTRILVSHRIEFALSADRVLVLENGEIVEDGPPQELKNSKTRFAALLSMHAAHSPLPQRTNNFAQPVTLTFESRESVESSEVCTPNTIIEAEDRRFGSVRSSTVRAYAARLAPGFAALVVTLLFLGRQGAAVSTDLWLTSWTNKPRVDLANFLSGYVLCIVVLGFMAYLRTLYVLGRGLRAGVECHKQLLHGVLRAPLTFFESNPVGRILNRFSRDLETVELSLPRSILDAGQCLIETIVVAIVITIVTPITLVLVAPVALLYYLLSVTFRPVSRELQRLTSISLSPIFTLTSDCLSGIESLRASALGGSLTRTFSAALDRHTQCTFMQTATNRWLGIRLETLGAALICAVGVAASFGWSASAGIAFSGLALAYASSMTSSMNWAIRSLSMVENSLTSFERIERYALTQTEHRSGALAPAGWPAQGAIELHRLSARYRPHLPLVLKEISCSIPAGSRVGIIGRTGSGKSSLILTLLRLIEPCGGRVTIDSIDVSTLTLESLRSSIAVVPQEPVLFSGRLRESLDPFGEYTDHEIESALNRVELRGFLSALPRGLDSEVREGGFNFSNGQRQLICLARALLRRSKVVILDEATASIDVHTDQTIQRAIRNEFSGSTLLVVAHRLGTIIDSDFIVALQDGELAQFGPPAALLQQSQSILTRFVEDTLSERQ